MTDGCRWGVLGEKPKWLRIMIFVFRVVVMGISFFRWLFLLSAEVFISGSSSVNYPRRSIPWVTPQLVVRFGHSRRRFVISTSGETRTY